MTDHQFTLSFKVTPEAIDELGHVNNVEYLRWIELVGRAHLANVGFQMDRLLALGGAFVARKHEIEYHAPAHIHDELIAFTKVTSMGGARSIREVEITLDGKVLARGKTEWVYVETATMRPRRVPEAIIEAFAIGQ